MHPDRRHFFRILLPVALLFVSTAVFAQQPRKDTESRNVRAAVGKPAVRKAPGDTRAAAVLPPVQVGASAVKPKRNTARQIAKPFPAKKDTLSAASPSVRTKPNQLTEAADTGKKDSSKLAADSAVRRQIVLPRFAGLPLDYRSLGRYLMRHNAIFSDTSAPLRDMAVPRGEDARDTSGTSLFYIILGILFLLGVIRVSFAKYFSDLFRAFFNPTLSQRQLRDQLSQTPFPALMLNIFFTLSAGLYLFLILRHFDYVTTARPLYLIPVFMALIMCIYLVKYLFIRFGGWLFGYRDASDGYIFTLYMINKVLGVALWPFILMLAFSPPALAAAALDVSLIMILLLLAYRYIRAFTLVRSHIFLNKFHFFIYLCGFEIAPVLIIAKLVLIWLNGA